MTFVDLTKAFDTVSREGLWKIMAKFGCPAKFIAMVRQFHDGMLARVQNDGEFSDPFPVTNGVKQGCVIASTLFSMMFSAMLTDAFQEGDNGIPIRYRFDGKLFNLRRLQAKSKVQTEVLDEFLFADDMVKGAPTEEKMQKDVDQVSDSCDSYDLTISIKKTEVVYQPAPGKPYKEPTITVKGQRLQVVDKFTYLGSTLSRVVHTDDEVNARIAKASGELQIGKRSHGGQKKRYKDTLKASLKDFYQQSWEQIAQDRTKWRASSKGKLVNRKQKESAKPSRNMHSGKPELRHHQQTSLVLSATGSLELRLVSSVILEHTNNSTHTVD